jgi:hypothetical protein
MLRGIRPVDDDVEMGVVRCHAHLIKKVQPNHTNLSQHPPPSLPVTALNKTSTHKTNEFLKAP